jgi:hypothetical protein
MASATETAMVALLHELAARGGSAEVVGSRTALARDAIKTTGEALDRAQDQRLVRATDRLGWFALTVAGKRRLQDEAAVETASRPQRPR